MLTLQAIENKLDEIRIAAAQTDDELAHALEDNLWLAVLKDTAAGNPLAMELAKKALESERLTFARWCHARD